MRFLIQIYTVVISLQIQQCDCCQRNSSSTPKTNFDVFHPIKVVSKAWYLVGIDLIQATKASAKGNKYFITQTDFFTKYVEEFHYQTKVLPVWHVACIQLFADMEPLHT